MKTRIILAIIWSFLMLWFQWWWMPILNFGYPDIYGFLLLGSLGFFIIFIVPDSYEPSPTLTLGIIFGIASGLLVLILIVVSIGSSAMFNAQRYRNVLGEVKTNTTFTADIAPVDISQIRIVDYEVASKLGDKQLGDYDKSLGSRTNIGVYTIQIVNGDLYWVAPILHSGFFKWKRFRTTPGYVMVSATRMNDVKIVTEVDGKPLSMKYQTKAHFGERVQRLVYKNGYRTKGRTDYSLEIDDEFHPYWVITVYDYTIGFGGRDATGVVIVNPETGDMKSYGIHETPSWVERIQPEDFIVSQLTWWGKYVHGFWNWSGRDKLAPTPGMSLVHGADGKAYWYTGITSTGVDEGTVGFVLVDTKTKETRYYAQAGAMETSAMTSAQGEVQEKGYQATFPITYNIDGVPTYVMALKDQAGLTKMISFVSIRDYAIVGVGDNKQEALRAYRSKLRSQGNDIAPEANIDAITIESLVTRFSMDINDGKSYYFLVVKGKEGILFSASSDVSRELPLTKAGDRVVIRYYDSKNPEVLMDSFDNLELSFQKNADLQRLEEKTRQVIDDEENRKKLDIATKQWEGLSPDEKLRLLKEANK